jgi:RNA polymerase sigma-70 factor (ECF subfamily)
VLVNGLPGVVILRDGGPTAIMAFTVVGGRIVEIHGIRDPARVLRLTDGALRSGQ